MTQSQPVGPQMREQARAMYEAGEGPRDIARAVGCSEISVYKWAQKYAWVRSKPLQRRLYGQRPHAWEPDAQRMYEAGVPWKEMAARFGKSETRMMEIARDRQWDADKRGAAMRRIEGDMRRCIQCGELKPLDAYAKAGRGGTGYTQRVPRARCRECERPMRIRLKRQARRRGGARSLNEMRAAKAERMATKHARAEARAALASHPLNQMRALLEGLLEARCEAEGRSVDAVQYKARWDRDAEFRESERQRQQRYKHANPEVAARYGDRRKRRAADTHDGTLTPKVVRRLFAEADLCPYCTRDMLSHEKVLDHKEPLARGGAHTLSNVLICCRACNRVKRDTPWAEWCARLASQAGVTHAAG